MEKSHTPSPEQIEHQQAREFHEQRFAEQAEKHAKRGFLRRVMDRNVDLNAQDFAHQEALRQNADIERRYHMEFKEWQKHLSVVVENLKKKRDDPEGEGKEIRPLLLVLGGGMQGPYGAGQVIALGEMGFTEQFDTVVGISAGACDAAYFLGGKEQALLGTSIYYEECTTKEFINFQRLHRIMDVGHLVANVMNPTGAKALDVEAIKNNRSEFFVQAMDAKTGEPTLLDAKNVKEGVLEAIHASMALPMIYRKSVQIDGNDYVDGTFEPLPIKAVIEKFEPTDVLILPNGPFSQMGSLEVSKGTYLLARLLEGKGSLNFLKKYLTQKAKLREAFEYIQKIDNVNVAMLWPSDSGLTQVTQEPDRIKAAVLEAEEDTYRCFGEKHKVII